MSKKVNGQFEPTISKIENELKKEGFGIITQINLQDKFKEKLNIEFRKYVILGACNPKLAYDAIQQEDKIGVMLPCNILLQEHADGQVEVSAINPLQSIGAVKNERLETLATEVSTRLKKVIDCL